LPPITRRNKARPAAIASSAQRGTEDLARVLDERGTEIAAAVVNVSLPDLDASALVADLAKRAPAAKVITTTRTIEAPPKDGGAVAATLSQPYSPQKLLDTVGRVLTPRG
jgi:DNA-binding NtrC family response regulator